MLIDSRFTKVGYFRRAATSPTTSPRPPVPAASNASLPARHR
ncbi:hypothetical protein RKD23_001101 [Streptomyces sp. SAI-170]